MNSLLCYDLDHNELALLVIKRNSNQLIIEFLKNYNQSYIFDLNSYLIELINKQNNNMKQYVSEFNSKFGLGENFGYKISE